MKEHITHKKKFVNNWIKHNNVYFQIFLKLLCTCRLMKSVAGQKLQKGQFCRRHFEFVWVCAQAHSNAALFVVGLFCLRGDVGGEHLGQLVVLQTALQEFFLCKVTVLVFVHSEKNIQHKYIFEGCWQLVRNNLITCIDEVIKWRCNFAS